MGMLLVEVVVSNQWLIYRSLPVVELVKEKLRSRSTRPTDRSISAITTTWLSKTRQSSAWSSESMGPFDQVFQFCNFTIGWLQLLAGQQPLLVLALLAIVALLRTLPSTLSSCQQQECVGETTNLFGNLISFNKGLQNPVWVEFFS